MADRPKRRRKRFGERQVLETCLHQGCAVLCYRCAEPFNLDKADQHWVYRAQREHLHEHGLDGPDEPANCRYSCEASHKVETFGTKATTAGSSIHRIRKADRIARGGNKPRGRKMQSRGFDKTKRRTMSGKVERRDG